MNLQFHINDFEGPLDLLLHLVKEAKMDIYEIKTSEIIEEYLSFIRKMENLNVDIASEYLVMAAELIHLKSRMLVNRKDDSVQDEEFSINTEEELKQKLIEYQKYKDISTDFQQLAEKRNEIYTKMPENYRDFIDQDTSLDNTMDVNDLLNAFLLFQERYKAKEPLNTKVTQKEYSVNKRIIEIRNIIKEKKKLNFFSLFEIMTRNYVIVTFLSILEMSKNNEIIIKQNNNFSDIIIEGTK